MKRDDRWDAFSNVPNDFDMFCNQVIPEIYLKPSVNEDVHKTFRVIKQLLDFSFYEYEFYDVAASKAMLSVEMAMKLRYLEITGTPWSDRRPLNKLIDWLNNNFYFDVYNDDFLNHFRHIRNRMAHSLNYSFAGPMMQQWISHPLDLINDMYEDPILRYKRILLSNTIQDKLDELLPRGTQVTIDNQTFILFHAWVSFINNKAVPNEIIFYFDLIFEITPDAFANEHYIAPVEKIVSCHRVNIEENGITGFFANGEVAFDFSTFKKQINQQRYDNWIKVYEPYASLIHHKQVLISHMVGITTKQRRSFHKISG